MDGTVSKENFIEKETDEIFKRRLKKVALWGAPVFLLLSGLDFIGTPGSFRSFPYLSIDIALVLCLIALLITKYSDRGPVFYRILAYVGVIASAAVMEMMVLKHGGEGSPYYAGIILLGVGVFGFLPARFFFHIVSAILIYSIYLFPAIAVDDITDLHAFITSNVFVVAIFSVALVMRYLSDKTLVNELGLKYDMERQKSHLELLADERTAELSDALGGLQESEARYRSLFNRMQNGFAYHKIITDDDGNPSDYYVLEVNKAYEELTGLGADEIVGKRITDIVPAVTGSRFDWIGEYGKVALNGEVKKFEQYFEPFDRWYSIMAYSPKKGYFVTIFDDISERKKTDEALRVSEQRLSGFLESATDGFFLFDGHLRVIEINHKAVEMMWSSKDEVLGKHIFDIFPLEAVEGEKSGLGKVLSKSGQYNRYLEIIQTNVPMDIEDFLFDGRTGRRYLSLKVFKVGDGLGVIATDITDRKAMEDQIFQDKQDWEDTFNAITDMITVHDMDFNIVHYNKAAEAMLGLQCIHESRKCFEYYHGKDGPPPHCPSRKVLETRRQETAEFYEPHLEKFVEVRAIPRFDRNRKMVGLIHVVRDITNRRFAEEKINRQFDRMQALRTIDMAITASLDLNHTLNVFLDQVAKELKADAVDVLLLNRKSMVLEYAASKGFKDGAVKYSRVRVGEGLAGRAAKERRTISAFDLPSKKNMFTRHELVKKDDVQTYLGVPVIAKGNVLGVLEIFMRSQFEPDDDWVDFLGALAGQAAIAIDNSRMFHDLKDSHDNLVMAYETTIEGWARALDYRDKETEGHSRRVADLTVKVAREMNIDEETIVHMHRGALLHDIGKIGVPDNILLKTTGLSGEEWDIMKRHPLIARDLLAGIPFLRPALDIPYCHHEKWDGTGYPRRLRGRDIPVAARIFAVVDHWDALTSDRPYRPAVPAKKVRDEMKSLSGASFDPKVVKIFLEMKIAEA